MTAGKYSSLIDFLLLTIRRHGSIPVICVITVFCSVLATLISIPVFYFAFANPWNFIPVLILPVAVPLIVAPLVLIVVFRVVDRLQWVEDELREHHEQLLREIREREQAEAQAQRERLRAEEASTAKSRYLAHMSHELRTPLNSIIGFSELMSQENYDRDTSKEYSGYIHGAARHLLAVINDVLDLSKVEAGKLELSRVWLDVSDTIRATLRLVEMEAQTEGLKLVTDIPADCPPLRADERVFKQILLNVLSNALKFTPTGGDITVSAQSRSAGWLDIIVTDTGIGIPSEDLERMLQPFEQANNVDVQVIQGAGLALTLVKALMELHGGELSMESHVGKGTAVTLQFPN